MSNKYKKINGTCCYHELKGITLVLIDEKSQIYFSSGKSCKQVIWKSSVYGIYIQSPFYIETS